MKKNPSSGRSVLETYSSPICGPCYYRWLFQAKKWPLYNLHLKPSSAFLSHTESPGSWRECEIFVAGSHSPTPIQRNLLKFFLVLVTLGNVSDIPCDSRSHFQALAEKHIIKVVTGQGRGIMASLFYPGVLGRSCSTFMVPMGIHLHRIICLLHPNCFGKAFLLDLWVANSPQLLSHATKDSQLSHLTIKREEL